MKTLLQQLKSSSIVLLYFITIANPAIGAEKALVFHNHQVLKTKLNDFLHSYVKSFHLGEYKLKAGSIDRRLNLRLCDKKINFFITRQNRRSRSITVGMRCEGSFPWLVYVPSQIYLFKKVLAARQLIRRGELIQHSDLIAVTREITNLYFGYFQNQSKLIGKTAKNTIMPGSLIRPQQVTEPKLVLRGQLVILVAEFQGIKVKMNGRALNSGSRGRNIKVQNLSSKRIIEGTVIGKGLVKINL